MTSEEYLNSKEPNVFILPEEWLQEYARIKCNELLEIVAEKAKVQKIIIQVEEYYDEKFEVDKDSILNAVDLNEFIK